MKITQIDIEAYDEDEIIAFIREYDPRTARAITSTAQAITSTARALLSNSERVMNEFFTHRDKLELEYKTDLND